MATPGLRPAARAHGLSCVLVVVPPLAHFPGTLACAAAAVVALGRLLRSDALGYAV